MDFELIHVGGIDETFRKMVQKEPALAEIMHANLSFGSTGFSLKLSMPGVTADEIRSFQTPGGIPFAFADEGGLLFGYAQFGPAIEIEFSYNARGLKDVPELWPNEQRKQSGGGEHWLMDMMLIESTTGQVLALRSGTLSPEVSRFCLDNIQRQLESGCIDSHRAGMLVANRTAKYPTIAQAMASCSVRCKTGD